MGFVLILSILIATVVAHPQNYDNLYGTPEDPCSKAGGMCIRATECEDSLKASPGLCPSQRSKGFECCHGVPKSERRCTKLGGECFPVDTCKPKFQRDANDCGNNQVCCHLE